MHISKLDCPQTGLELALTNNAMPHLYSAAWVSLAIGRIVPPSLLAIAAAVALLAALMTGKPRVRAGAARTRRQTSFHAAQYTAINQRPLPIINGLM